MSHLVRSGTRLLECLPNTSAEKRELNAVHGKRIPNFRNELKSGVNLVASETNTDSSHHCAIVKSLIGQKISRIQVCAHTRKY